MCPVGMTKNQEEEEEKEDEKEEEKEDEEKEEKEDEEVSPPVIAHTTNRYVNL